MQLCASEATMLQFKKPLNMKSKFLIISLAIMLAFGYSSTTYSQTTGKKQQKKQ
jgi:hypothetical protein